MLARWKKFPLIAFSFYNICKMYLTDSVLGNGLNPFFFKELSH